MSTTLELERRLEEMFAAQAQALTVPVREAADIHLIPAGRVGPRRRRYGFTVAALAGFSALLAVAGLTLLSTRDGQVSSDGSAAQSTAPTPSALPRPAFTVDTKQVSLTADALLIDVDGKRFATASPMEVHGDPGTRNEYTTLELTWMERGVEMRLNIYFLSDGRQWWSNEIRTYDGAKQGEWITYTGDFFRSQLGTPFVGDLDITAKDHGVSGRLRLPGLRLEAFRRPGVCASPTAPLGLEPDADTISLSTDASGYATSVTLLDTATCLPVAAPGDYEYRWALDGPSILKFSTGGPRTDIQPIGVGTTSLRVQAMERRSGRVVSETRVAVTVAPGTGPIPSAPTPEGTPPTR